MMPELQKEIDDTSPFLEREGNTARIQKQEGIYTLIYSLHNRPADPTQLPTHCDGLVFEGGLARWDEDPEKVLNRYRTTHPQYSSLFPVLEKRRMSVYFADARSTTGMSLRENIVIGAETAAAAWLLCTLPGRYKQYVKKREETKLSRRAMLKLGIRASIGTYLVMPLTEQIAAYGSNVVDFGQGAAVGYQKLCHATHPEHLLSLIKIRNVILAYKEQWLMAHAAGRPHLATIIGPGHACIEEDIQSSQEDKLAFLMRSYVRPFLRIFPSKESVYSIVQFDFNGEEWKQTAMYEIPELKKLVSPQE